LITVDLHRYARNVSTGRSHREQTADRQKNMSRMFVKRIKHVKYSFRGVRETEHLVCCVKRVWTVTVTLNGDAQVTTTKHDGHISLSSTKYKQSATTHPACNGLKPKPVPDPRVRLRDPNRLPNSASDRLENQHQIPGGRVKIKGEEVALAS
jgi:hypothetical protein